MRRLTSPMSKGVGEKGIHNDMGKKTTKTVQGGIVPTHTSTHLNHGILTKGMHVRDGVKTYGKEAHVWKSSPVL